MNLIPFLHRRHVGRVVFNSAFRLGVTKWFERRRANSRPRRTFVSTRSVCSHTRVQRTRLPASPSSTFPFPRPLYCSRYRLTGPPAIYVGYLCNGSSWLPARSTNTGSALARGNRIPTRKRNLYTERLINIFQTWSRSGPWSPGPLRIDKSSLIKILLRGDKGSNRGKLLGTGSCPEARTIIGVSLVFVI